MQPYLSPRVYQRKPAQTFWLQKDTAVVTAGKGKAAQTAVTRFRRELKTHLDDKSAPNMGNAGKGKSTIVFKLGRPKSFLKQIEPSTNGAVRIGDAGSLGAESYRLEITPAKIVIRANTEAGFRHACLALWDQFDSSSYFFTGGIIEDEPAFGFRSFLINFAHDYKAPRKGERRKKLKRFDFNVAENLIKQAAKARMNSVIIDVENAVRYRSHPEIARSHSVPMTELRKLVRLANSLGLDVIPKTNFSKADAPKQGHNDWFEPYHEMPDGPEYFKRAGQIMDELIKVTGSRYYHIGMDEDHTRGSDEIVTAVLALRKHLLNRGVTPIMWVDLGKRYQPKEYQDKYINAVKRLPRDDLIITHWQYFGRNYKEVTDLVRQGFRVICCTSLNPKWRTDATRAFSRRAYEQKADGMLGSTWMPVLPNTEEAYVNAIQHTGKAFWTAG